MTAWVIFLSSVTALLNNDMFFRNGQVVTILGIASYRFVGIAATFAFIMVMLLPVVAVVFGTIRQKLLAMLLIAPAIYLLISAF